MSTNRHAQIRYTVLDSCFSNFQRLYDYDDLLTEVNAVLNELGSEGIQLRQLQYDIEHMKSDNGWAIEFELGLKKGLKKAWRYNDINFSIANHPLNVNDSEQLETTIAILSRYKHREEFSWLEELIPRMTQAFELQEQGENGIINYEENIFLKGKNHLGILFNLILKKKRIKISYKPFYADSMDIIISPYYLKQYNSRWFLFAKPDEIKDVYNYPLDRIESIEELTDNAESSDINWQDYFDDIIGVSYRNDQSLTKIKMKFSDTRISYVLTKPIHSSQKVIKDQNGNSLIEIEVVPNRELVQVILSFGPDIEILEPAFLRDEIKQKIKEMTSLY